MKNIVTVKDLDENIITTKTFQSSKQAKSFVNGFENIYDYTFSNGVEINRQGNLKQVINHVVKVVVD